jgi:hypothetical protein
MRTKLTIFAVLAAAAATAALVMNGCGSSCGPGNCAGCCDANSQCQVAAADHCGKNGLACSVCSAGQSCFLGTCQFNGGNGSGNGTTTGTNGTTTGTTNGTTTGTTNGTTTGTTNGTTTGTTNGTTTGTTNGTTTGTTNGTTTGTTNGTTTGTTTTSTTGTTGTTTTSTTGTTGTTGSVACANPPPAITINNGGIGDACTGSATDGGFQAGSCATTQICYDLYGNGTPRCTAACATGTPCPGQSFCDIQGGASSGACVALGHGDGTGCPGGLVGALPTEHPNDLAICFPNCVNAGSCNAPGGTTTFTCASNGQCHCSSDTDCGTSGLKCDMNSGACYLPCSTSQACPANSGCCLTYNSKSFCDPFTR